MTKAKRLTALGMWCMVALVWADSVQAQGLAVSAKAGTLGPGIELTTAIMRPLNLRVGAHYLTYSHEGIMSDLDVEVQYEADGKLANGELLLDWHPFLNQFRLTAGAIYNASSVDALVIPIESYEIDGREFTPEKIGSLAATVNYEQKISPYIGLGVGNAVSNRVSFALDLGLNYTDSPNVAMEGDGMIGPTALQAADLEEGFKTFRFYPVFSFGFSVALAKR